MKPRNSWILLFLAAAAGLPAAVRAVDVQPSRQTVPEKFREPGGKKWSIFQGDPERIKRANKVDVEKFQTSLEVEPATLSAEKAREEKDAAELKVTFKVQNTGKKTYRLTYPDSQRFDIAVTDQAGMVVYLWSSDKMFVQETGMSMLNEGDKMSYTESIPLRHFDRTLSPGTYTVQAIVSNYPDLIGKADFIVTP